MFGFTRARMHILRIFLPFERNDVHGATFRIIGPLLRFRAHSFRDNTLAWNTPAAGGGARPTGHRPVLCICSCTFLRCFSTTSPLVYSSPMYPVGEHTAAPGTTLLSAAIRFRLVPSGEITLVHPSPIPGNQAQDALPLPPCVVGVDFIPGMCRASKL